MDGWMDSTMALSLGRPKFLSHVALCENAADHLSLALSRRSRKSRGFSPQASLSLSPTQRPGRKSAFLELELGHVDVGKFSPTKKVRRYCRTETSREKLRISGGFKCLLLFTRKYRGECCGLLHEE